MNTNTGSLSYSLEKRKGVGKDFQWVLSVQRDYEVSCVKCSSSLFYTFFCRDTRLFYCDNCESGYRDDHGITRQHCAIGVNKAHEHFSVEIVKRGDKE